MALFMAYQRYLNYFTFFYFQIQTVKTTMTRICRFYHNVPKNEDKCSEGHYLCCTLDCSARGCKFVTRPLHMTSFDHALKIMELHMNGAHSDLTTNKLTSEDENIKMEKKEADESTKKKKEDDDRKHQQEENDDSSDEFTCPICFKMFCSKKNVKRHVDTEHKRKGRLNCPDCDKSFASRISLNYHEKKCHSGGSEILCNNCDEIFHDFKSYIKHERSHKSSFSEPEYKCEECHATFSTNSNLNRHAAQIHLLVNFNIKKKILKIYPFICDECEFSTKRKHNLDVHKLLIHGDPDPQDVVSCANCPKTFAHKSNMRRYERRHHESKLIACKILTDLVGKAMK